MFETLFSMKGKTCLVTGGSRGIGNYIAKGFLQAGARRVYITARTADVCDQAAEELCEYGECVSVPGNVGDLDGIKALAAIIADKEERLDVLVNNAGSAWGAPVESFPEKGWDKVMDLNVKSPFFLTQAFLEMLKKGKNPENTASIINIGSIAGIVGNSLSSYSYGPSKAAIHQMTRNLAKDLAESHIRVNAIAPGRFFSKMTAYVSKEEYEQECVQIPLHRWGKEEDIAGIAIMLASQAGGFVTGQIISTDGGSSLGG